MSRGKRGETEVSPSDRIELALYSSPMKRAFAIVTLVFCVVWQAVALAYIGGPGIMVSGDASHEHMHLHNQSHHHDADGSIAFDLSLASYLHMTFDSGAAATMVSLLPLQLLRTADVAPRASQDDALTSPFVEGPLRPPRPLV